MVMKQRSRYKPLSDYLRGLNEDEVTLGFTEIETVLGEALPPSARASRAWWSNRESGLQAAAWLQAGFRVIDVNLLTERATFQKRRSVYLLRRESNTLTWDAETIKALREHMELTQSQFAEVLGVRQQTVSEWEQGVYAPKRATSKHLTRVAEGVALAFPKSRTRANGMH
jgi:DNA-binding transcriptional regulator YiaG